MKIVFRVDASLKIGTGHIMRCLTLAQELKKRGANVVFICRSIEGNLHEMVESKGVKVVKLPQSNSVNESYCFHSNWLDAHWQEDATQSLLHIKGADWLIVDHYALDEKWESIIHPHIDKILVIDDLADREHVCDILLDQNYYLNAETRYKHLVNKECQLMLGPKFALLREEFAYARARLKRGFSEIKKIMVFFGGVDANNDAGKAIEAISGFKGEVIIVSGYTNKNLSKLEDFCTEHSNFRLFRSINNMAELMANADLAIGAGGSTSWERAATGLPTLAWPIAENQIHVLYDLSKAGIVKLTSPEKLEDDLILLNGGERMEMSRKGMEICDGEGTVRVANKLWSR